MKPENFSKTKNLEEAAGVSLRSLLLAALLAALTAAALWFLVGWAYPGDSLGCGTGAMGTYAPMMVAQPAVSLAVALNLLNLFLLTYLIAQYIYMHQQLRSEFTLGLVLLAYVLLAHSLMANPLLFSGLMGYGLMGGPLSFLPALFTTIAASVLLYLNSR